MKTALKRYLALLMSLVICFSFLSVYVFAEGEREDNAKTRNRSETIDSGKCGDKANWKLFANGTLQISGSGEMNDYEWDSDKLTATQPWNGYYDTIQAVVIAEGITGIGDEAFSDCACLASVTIPNSATRIGMDAFIFCTNLTSVTIPDSVTNIGDYAFDHCASLTDISYSGTRAQWNRICFGDDVWKNDTATVHCTDGDIEIENGEVVSSVPVSEASTASFDNILKNFSCSYANHTLTLTGVEDEAEENNADLEEWRRLSDELIRQGVDSQIKKIVFEFSEGSGLGLQTVNGLLDVIKFKELTIDDYDGYLLITQENNVEVNASVGLESITFSCVPEDSDESHHFQLASEVLSIDEAPESDFFSYFEDSWKSAYPDRTIKSTAVSEYSNSEKYGAWILFHENKNFLSDNSSGNSTTPALLDSGECGDNATWELTEDGTLYIRNSGEMADYEWNSDARKITQPWNDHYERIKAVIIEEGITRIGSHAFARCTNLERATIPDSLTCIGYCSFLDCTSLKSVTIPKSVTSIGDWAFGYCTNLTAVVIPDSVKNIESMAFGGCKSLKDVTIPDSVTSIGQSAFDGTPWLENQTDEFVVAGDGILLKYNGSASDVVIPKGIKKISSAFCTCTRSSGDTASIACFTPHGYQNLRSVTIPDSVISIGDFAFSCCYFLKSVTIPESVTDIGSQAFMSCRNLTDIIIPSSVTCIGNQTFFNCTNLKDINYSGSEAQWNKIDFGVDVWENVLNTVTIHFNFTGKNAEVRSMTADEMYNTGKNAEARSMTANEMYNLGTMYESGQGAERDYRTALEWYLKAADGGNTNAMRNISFMYELGFGVEQNPETAMEWSLKAADGGNTSAMGDLGSRYRNKYSSEHDYKSAMEWYLKAAEGGNAFAMHEIGNMYENGEGVEKNIAVANEWYEKAEVAGYLNYGNY